MSLRTRLVVLSSIPSLLLAFSACQQKQTCTLKLEQAPELRGFRLGMSLSDIQKRYPGFPSVSPNQVGLAKVEISPVYVRNVLDRPIGEDVVSFVSAEPFPEIKELRHVELKLIDEKVTEITVYYSDDVKWNSADEFALKAGESLKVDGSWEKIGQDSDYSEVRSMQCGGALKGEGFRISAGFRKPILENPNLEDTRLPYVQLEDFWAGHMTEYDRKTKIEEQRKHEEEKRKQTFKP